MKKIIAASVQLILMLLGLLWFLQGADILHIRPILCFADCEYITGVSWVWEIAGAISIILGFAFLTLAHTTFKDWSAIIRKFRG